MIFLNMPEVPRTFPRWDTVYRLDGQLSVLVGTEGPSPVRPTLPPGAEEVCHFLRRADPVAASLVVGVPDAPSELVASEVEFRFEEPEPATPSRHIMFDLDSGEMLTRGGATGAIWRVIASQCMPGTTPELLDEWYSAHMEHDDPKQPGRLVWMPTGPADRIAQLEALVASLRAGGSVAPS